MVVIESQYLPRISYFAKIIDHDKIMIDIHENYQKQSFRSRCQIRSANKPIENLIIPVKKSSERTMKYIELDYGQKWNHEHLHAIKSAYGKAPYFEYYWEDLKAILISKPDKLTDLNALLLKFCLKCLQFSGEVVFTDRFEKTYDSAAFVDARWLLDKKNKTISTDIPQYQQVFGKEFEPDLSIIDLIFCCGPESRSILNRVITAFENDSSTKDVY